MKVRKNRSKWKSEAEKTGALAEDPARAQQPEERDAGVAAP